MPHEVRVYVPTGMRPLTGGVRVVTATGRTIADVAQDLESRYPGFYESLVEDGRLRSGLAVAINNEEQPLGLLAKVQSGDELHILPAMAGGAAVRGRRAGCQSRQRRWPRRRASCWSGG